VPSLYAALKVDGLKRFSNIYSNIAAVQYCSLSNKYISKSRRHLRGHMEQITSNDTTQDRQMPLACPRCQSERIETRSYGRKAGGAIGTVAGAASGAAGAIGGAEIGATAGLIVGPIGSLLGGFAGAIIGGLIGGAAGGATGAKMGEVVDDAVLDNYRCLACEYTFNKKQL
jgi:hypothetical protein